MKRALFYRTCDDGESICDDKQNNPYCLLFQSNTKRQKNVGKFISVYERNRNKVGYMHNDGKLCYDLEVIQCRIRDTCTIHNIFGFSVRGYAQRL